MDKITEELMFTMSIPLKAHAIAQDFCQKQPDTNKAKQIYLNTLAVYSVNEYLGYFSISTNLLASDSWNSSLQYLSDVADLDIPNYGRLECRPVLPNDTSCYVPADVWSDRSGYVAVQFDADLKEASFLGFLTSVQSSSIALDEWQPFETFIETLSQAIQTATAQATAQATDKIEAGMAVATPPVAEVKTQGSSAIVRLSQWLEGAIDQTWQRIRHDFLSPELSPSFRATPDTQLAKSAQVVCSKQVNWADEASGIPLSLIIGLASSEQSEETDIWVKISPQEPDQHLPLDLELLVVDEDDHTVIQTKSRGTEGIQLRFGAQPNEQFGVKVIQGLREMVETFVV
ncbi:MAG: DUF1822 family protein [Cyanobacteria bacterium P01_F01_bin.150]